MKPSNNPVQASRYPLQASRYPRQMTGCYQIHAGCYYEGNKGCYNQSHNIESGNAGARFHSASFGERAQGK